MSALKRASSTFSCSSTTSTATASTISTETSNTAVDNIDTLARRRVTPEQLQALNNLFLAKSHPSRQERLALANEIRMHPKTVANWFQNRRSTAKKHEKAWDAISRQRALRPTVSLDKIASLSERPMKPSITVTSLSTPFTPRRTNIRSGTRSDDLWSHMPSSPLAPSASPSMDKARLSVLPLFSKSRRSLEWACANARGRTGEEEESFSSSSSIAVGMELDVDWDDTDTEVDEAITPDVSSASFSGFVTPLGKEESHLKETENYHQSADVEAAFVLLDFMNPR